MQWPDKSSHPSLLPLSPMPHIGFGLVVEHSSSQEQDGQVFILQGIVPGSPSDRTEQLQPCDRLLGVLGSSHPLLPRARKLAPEPK